MKGILEFDLPEDRDAFEQAVHGSDWEGVLWEFCETWLRPRWKHETEGPEMARFAEKARSEITALMEERGLEFSP